MRLTHRYVRNKITILFSHIGETRLLTCTIDSRNKLEPSRIEEPARNVKMSMKKIHL